jgi:putative transposase
VRSQLAEIVTTLRPQFPDVATMLTDACEDLLAFTHFPLPHWRKIWSTNPLERLNGEIKRRTNVVGIFPNAAALLRLSSCVLIRGHDEWQTSGKTALRHEAWSGSIDTSSRLGLK